MLQNKSKGGFFYGKTNENRQYKLSGKLINSFLLPNIGQSLFIQLELVYMSYFLTDLCGFDLGVVTFILTSTAAVDLVWVFVTGIVIEKMRVQEAGKIQSMVYYLHSCHPGVFLL